MPRGYAPSVFVSSTCYDLSQVRIDLKRFVESLGYEALISESPAFPVDPQAGTFENCVTAVRDRADLFVLVIGGRYGSQRVDGKSITNLEYIEAKAKGVPIYVFVAKAILHALAIWRDNQDADFSRTVDTPRLFEFVQQLRGEAGHWVYGFEEAGDIIATLRQQWALLFTDALAARARLRTVSIGPALETLPAGVLAVLLERPRLWEHRFFSAALRAELDHLGGLRRDIQYGLRLGPVIALGDVLEVTNWIQRQLARLDHLVHSLTQLGNVSLSEALGPTGVPGNPELLAYVARRIGETAREVLRWTLEFSDVSASDECRRVLELSSRFSHNVIENIFGFPDRIDVLLDQAAAAIARNEPFSGHLTLNIDLPIPPELDQELELLRARAGLA